jgi:hypothetical protein
MVSTLLTALLTERLCKLSHKELMALIPDHFDVDLQRPIHRYGSCVAREKDQTTLGRGGPNERIVHRPTGVAEIRQFWLLRRGARR